MKEQKKAYIKTALCYQNLDILFSQAKNLDAAGEMAKSDKSKEEAVSLFQKAGALYLENSQPDKAAETLVKAAKMLEDSDPAKASQIIGEACSIFESEDREIFAPNTFRYAISLAIKNEQYDQALDLLARLGKINLKLNQMNDLAKAHLTTIIIHLKREDSVSADRVYQEFMSQGFSSSSEAKAAGELLDAMEKGSDEELKKVLAKQVFTFLDNQTIKLSRSLEIKEEKLENRS